MVVSNIKGLIGVLDYKYQKSAIQQETKKIHTAASKTMHAQPAGHG